MVATIKISELPAGQNINNVSGDLEYKATNNIKFTTVNANGKVEISRIPLLTSVATISAFAGGGQGSATVLTAYYNAVTTVTSAGDSVKLGAIADMPIGTSIVVKNCTATNAMDVFPDVTSQIFYITLQAVNAAVSVAPGNAITFYRRAASIWDAY